MSGPVTALKKKSVRVTSARAKIGLFAEIKLQMTAENYRKMWFKLSKDTAFG